MTTDSPPRLDAETLLNLFSALSKRLHPNSTRPGIPWRDCAAEIEALKDDPSVARLAARQLKTSLLWGAFDEIRCDAGRVEKWTVTLTHETRERLIRGLLRLPASNAPSQTQNSKLKAQNRDAPTLYVMSGIPGGGKSTWIEKTLRAEHPDIEIVSTDDLRERFAGDVGDQTRNADVFAFAHGEIERLLKKGRSVVFDSTGILKTYRATALRIARNRRSRAVAVVADTPFRVALERNRKRERFVPEHVLARFYLEWERPTADEADERLIIGE